MLKRNNSKSRLNAGITLVFHRLVLLSLLIVAALSATQAQYRAYETRPDPAVVHDQAAAAMRDGNYAIAYCLWQPLAANGDRDAQYSIGWMFHNGYGLRIDDNQALRWWLQAASRGSIDAHHALGELYANGQGVEKNLAIALGWFISAALKDHPLAKETLVAMLNDKDELAQRVFRQLLSSNWSILGDAMEVSVDRANTRSGPDKSFPIITVLEKGHLVLPLKTDGNWVQVGITGSGKTAWIYQTLISRPAGIYSVE